MPASPLRLGEFVATLALAQDNAFGQPLESQLRSCLLAAWMGESAGFPAELRETVYWVALLRYIGCTGHAHEVATVFGDVIAIRAQTLVHESWLLRSEGLLWKLRARRRAFRYLWVKPGFLRTGLRHYLAYYRRDFHPSQVGSADAIERARLEYAA